ncbi:MAG: SGNH/GDSL hydrolase family protein [Leptospiraceae bacterium]|nr:SGNH/GDSL hydrolase family protein [Leptospiraceae bacterium]MCK6380768.1 SGNH/GDSL hydrolase family protein [Leptospiraceae bacterium]NUM41138.1 SGNH/GDSL hydrolase family protein [Leptospiraceae bacterium]
MKKEFNTFYKDKRFFIPILTILLFEAILQTGIYSPFLKKNSYAANVNRITNHILNKQTEFDPDILIVGTSVAYQGLSVKILNEKVHSTGLKIQSIAIPGSEVIVQHQVISKSLPKFKKVKLIIYVGEVLIPWVSQTDLSLPTLSMISEFNRIDAIKRAYNYDYDVRAEDIFYILSRSIAYRRDFREFVLDPNKRLKHLKKMKKEPNLNPWDYENSYNEKISSYNVKTIEECKAKTSQENADPIPISSNAEHKIALFKTCALAGVTSTESKQTDKTNLYFKRLSQLFSEFQKRGIKTINVFAPYSTLMNNLGGKERVELWTKELEKIQGKENTIVVDMQNILPNKNNGDYYYDIVHLNMYGMEKFSEALGDYLNKNIRTLIP